MFLLRGALLLLIVGYSTSNNTFESIQGCQQFNGKTGYYTFHPYFDTSAFNNIKTDKNGVTRMRIGVLGAKHAAIRFTSVNTDSDVPMTEIALAHYDNTRTDIRKYSKTIPIQSSRWTSLGAYHIQNVMNSYSPTMITITILRGGLVYISLESGMTHVLQFYDPTFSFKFMGFTKWDVPVVFFYDCPLVETEPNGSTTVAPGSSQKEPFNINSCLKVVDCGNCNSRDNCFSVKK